MAFRKSLLAAGLTLGLALATVLTTPGPADAGVGAPPSNSNLAGGIVLLTLLGLIFGPFGGGDSATSTKSPADDAKTTGGNTSLGGFKIKF